MRDIWTYNRNFTNDISVWGIMREYGWLLLNGIFDLNQRRQLDILVNDLWLRNNMVRREKLELREEEKVGLQDGR